MRLCKLIYSLNVHKTNIILQPDYCHCRCHENINTSVVTNGKYSGVFSCDTCVCQGGNVSPVLFTMSLNS
jgi:hypothetical protein